MRQLEIRNGDSLGAHSFQFLTILTEVAKIITCILVRNSDIYCMTQIFNMFISKHDEGVRGGEVGEVIVGGVNSRWRQVLVHVDLINTYFRCWLRPEITRNLQVLQIEGLSGRPDILPTQSIPL